MSKEKQSPVTGHRSPSAPYSPNVVRAAIALRGLRLEDIATDLRMSVRNLKDLITGVNIKSRPRLIDYLQPEISQIAQIVPRVAKPVSSEGCPTLGSSSPTSNLEPRTSNLS